MRCCTGFYCVHVYQDGSLCLIQRMKGREIQLITNVQMDIKGQHLAHL